MNLKLIIVALVSAIALSAGSYYAGWEMRGDHDAAIALKAKLAAEKLLKIEQVKVDKISTELELEKRNIKTVTIEVIKEIPKYTTVYIEKAGDEPKPIPPAIYTLGTLRMYNRALRPDLPISASEFAYPAGGTDITKAEIDTKDILEVHAENAGKYAECRSQLNKLIDYEIARKSKTQLAPSS